MRAKRASPHAMFCAAASSFLITVAVFVRIPRIEPAEEIATQPEEIVTIPQETPTSADAMQPPAPQVGSRSQPADATTARP